MARTKDGKLDLEAAIISRCVRALKLTGTRDRGSWNYRLSTEDISRILRYLAERFGASV